MRSCPPQACGQLGRSIPTNNRGFGASDPQARGPTLRSRHRGAGLSGRAARCRRGRRREHEWFRRSKRRGARRRGASRRTTSKPRSRCSAPCCCRATRSPPRSRRASRRTDFYKPAHGHVYDAIQALYGQGEPADPVTVADELRRADLLDVRRRAQRAAALQAGTPASANAGALRARSSTSSRCCGGSSASPATSPRWATTTPTTSPRPSTAPRRSCSRSPSVA